MKKMFRYYAMIWLLLLAVFNVAAFVSPLAKLRMESGTFWVGYAAIMAAFVGQLVCAWLALRPQTPERAFLLIPVSRVSYAGLLLTLCAGTSCMVLPGVPTWAGVILCFAVLAATVIAVIRVLARADFATDVGGRVKDRSLFIRSLTVDAEGLMARTADPGMKAKIREVCDAVRFSDPMGHDALAGTEAQITLRFAALSNAVSAGEQASADAAAQELLALLSERNRKCKLLK